MIRIDASAYVAAVAQSQSTIAERLERRFGLGSRPELRRQLYQRLEELVNDPEIGKRAYDIITAAAADAVGKGKPGNYFAYVVCERLRERSLIQRPEAVF